MVHIEINFWDVKAAKRLFQNFQFIMYQLKNNELLHELPFYDKLSIEKILKAFKRYTRTYRMEITDSKDTLVQLKASK